VWKVSRGRVVALEENDARIERIETVLQSREPWTDEQAILAQAAYVGFSLVPHETDVGQLVWEWNRGDKPRPQFLRRAVALEWMRNYLAFFMPNGSNVRQEPEGEANAVAQSDSRL
jgi:hypothetical protein